MPKKTKSVLPYMNFYPRDFFTDPLVEIMSAEEVGAYALLIFRSWFETPGGSVPDENRTLARWSHVTERRFIIIKKNVLAPWELRSDGRWHQKRVIKEFTHAVKRSRAAKKSAEDRWSKRNAGGMRLHSDRNAIRTDQNRSDQNKHIPPKPPKGGEGGRRRKRNEPTAAETGAAEALARKTRLEAKRGRPNGSNDNGSDRGHLPEHENEPSPLRGDHAGTLAGQV